MGIASPAGAGGTPGTEARSPGRVIPFGKYLLLDRIAVGGMAEVYVAKSFGIEGFEKLLAIKRILPTMAEDEDFIEMFIDEAKIAGQLSHANVVPIYELGKLGDSHYIAMEYVWGKDLLQIMNRFRRLRKRMPAVMVGWVALKICEALDYAHNKRDRRGNPLNIIHRDISPQNVLVSYEGQVKLIDFGIAKAASRTTKTQAGVLKGKFGYMSPEQVRGQPIDHRSDLFAVGTCMYEMITSERLFLSESDFSTLEKVRNAEVAPPSSIVTETPKELEEIVMKALKREPGERYQRAGEMQEELQRFLAAHEPPFTAGRLSSWLKTAFSPEMGQEKGKLDSFAQIGRPSVLSGSATGGGPRRPDIETKPSVDAGLSIATGEQRAPATDAKSVAITETREEGRGRDGTPAVPPPTAAVVEPLPAVAGESTQITPSPFEATQLADSHDDLAEQPTEIFFSAFEGGGQPSEAPPAASISGTGALDVARSATDERWPPPPPALDPTSTVVPQVIDSSVPAPPQLGDPQDSRTADAAAQTASFPRIPDAESASGARAVKTPTRVWLYAGILAAAALAFGALFPVIFGGEPTGGLEVRLVPDVPGATFQIDGRPAGSGPAQSVELAIGDHTLVIDAPEHTRYHRIVRIERELKVVLEVALQKEQRADAVVLPPPVHPVVAPPTPAPAPTTAVSLVRGPDPAAEPRVTPEASAGREKLRPIVALPRERGTPDTRDNVREASPREVPGETRSGNAEPPPAIATATGFGTLVVNAMPWARVFIDGRDTGRSTPITGMRIRAGEHSVGLRTPNGEMHTFSVTIENGETERLIRNLAPAATDAP